MNDQRPVGPWGSHNFRDWADVFDCDLAELIARIANGKLEPASKARTWTEPTPNP